MISIYAAAVIVAATALGTFTAGWLGGRAWERGSAEAEDLADREDWYEQGRNDRELEMETALVPLPARLPSATQRDAMYDTLGGGSLHDLPPAGVASSETLGPRPGEQAEPVTTWDSNEPEERAPTISELADNAEYALTWRELGGLRDSAYDWYDRTFATGAFRAVRG